MMTRRFSIGASLAVLTLLAVAFALWPRPRGVTRADFERLRPGMTATEVQRQLHGPPRDDLKSQAIVWVPHADGKRRSAIVLSATPDLGYRVAEHFRSRPPNEVPPKSASESWYFPGTTAGRGTQAVWIAETGLIAAYFGQDGRLQQTYFSTVHATRPPTVVDWVASRPRMIRKSLGL